MWERVRLFRTYQAKVVPALLQTAAYMCPHRDAILAQQFSGFNWDFVPSGGDAGE